ncbi:MAG TPA: ABC transporter ATP-binding protein [Candidatus Pullichristensenella stercoripullorum]|nr:ABC transporter ATP-binding protein [Candidatus Pullichristensenella stercoripullorum]
MLLQIKDLVVAYGQIDALHGISLNVEQGQIVAIIGANGAGKTTLLNAISGVLPVKSGSIIFDGKPLPGSVHGIVQHGITQVPEGRKIFAGLSVEENLVMGGFSTSKAKSKENIDRMFSLFPILKERRRQQAGTLSGGEQQMLAIARGMMAEPRLLLLDEPSLGLAPIIVKQVFSLIAQIREMGYTIVLVEQNAQQAMRLSDHTYVLENGCIRIDGTSEEMLANKDVIEAYLGEKQE